MNSIYGVDIDAQAVETTKLSLLLKVLEDESAESLDAQLSFLHERALPDLAANVKCGNSLIGPEFYDDGQLGLAGLDSDERYRINIFDWETEFPQIAGKAVSAAQRGFDAVIGNPPYIRIQNLREFAPLEVDFYKRRYASAGKGNYDIYVVFVERGLSLLKERGLLGYILPHKFMTAQYGEPLRGLLSAGLHLSRVVHFGDSQIFAHASTYTAVMVLSRLPVSETTVVQVGDLDGWRLSGTSTTIEVPTASLSAEPWCFVDGPTRALLDKTAEGAAPLGEVASRIAQGVITGADKVFLFDMVKTGGPDEVLATVRSSQLDSLVQIEKTILKPVVRSGSVGRFGASPTVLALFPYSVGDEAPRLFRPSEMRSLFPRAWEYLSTCRSVLLEREKGRFRGEEWYQYSRSQNLGFWEQPKILVPYMVPRLAAYLDADDHFYFVNVTTGGYGITCGAEGVSLGFLTGLLNSRLLDWIFRQSATNFRGGYFAANKQYIENLPIRRPMGSQDERLIERIEEEVGQMQSLKAQYGSAFGHDLVVLEREIESLDARLDHLVYDLYGLSDEEVALVEAGDAARA